MIDSIIVDADLCIKLGSSEKYEFLYDILPMISSKIYMHTHARSEVMLPASAVKQLNKLIAEGKIQLVNENELDARNRAVFDAAYRNLEKVMIDPRFPRKNKGEACSLAYAKATGIPVFATDEKNLQPIIDSQLNTGLNDIRCLRIGDIVQKAHTGEIEIKRKDCRVLWVIAGNKKEVFDKVIWPAS